MSTAAVASVTLALTGVLVALGLASAAQKAPTPQAVSAAGQALFASRCASCHEPAVGRAPNRERLAALGPMEIVNVLKNGAMRPMAQGLSALQLGEIATFLSPPSVGAAKAPPPADPPKCSTLTPLRVRPDDWTSWGREPTNWRDQPDPGFRPSSAPKLKVKWAFAHFGGKYGQPTVAGGRVFLTSSGGKAYALDAKTGCMIWRFSGARSRTTITVGRLASARSGFAVFLGGAGNNVYALDAGDGSLIWKQRVQTHPLGILTGAPVLWRGRLYAPLSSYEELTASVAKYPCCTFRGGVAALDAATGRPLWTTHTISRRPSPSHLNRSGTQMYGPAGAAVWSAPTIDAIRRQLYVATGDSYTDVKEGGSDAIMAMDLATGAVKWRTQVTASDNYLSGCEAVRMTNCPTPLGHDFDFGAAPILMRLASGADILLAGQKSGIVYGLNPEDGRVLWKTRVGHGGPLGGVEWGMASDGKRLYVGVADAFMPSPPGRPGLAALDPATGRILWFTTSPLLSCGWTGGAPCMNGISAPPTVAGTVVFAGDLDGRFRAYDAATGRVLWSFDTGSRSYATVNGVAAQHGGDIDGPGPVVAEGMVFVYSGYLGSLGGAPTNPLLVFSVGGR